MLDLEIIIVDDSSDDGSWEWLKSLDAQGIRPIRLPTHSERATARNAGLRDAQGEFILFLDDDDLLASTAVEQLAIALRSHPGAVASVSQFEYFGYWTGKPRRSGRTWCGWAFWDAVYGTNLGRPGVLFRTKILRHSGGFSPEAVPREDIVAGLRIGSQGPVVVLGAPLYRVRTRPLQFWGEIPELHLETLLSGEAVEWCPAAERARLPRALRAAPHVWAARRSVERHQRVEAANALARAVAYDPGLLRCRLLIQWEGTGFIKAYAPRWVRSAAAALRGRRARKHEIAISRAKDHSSGRGTAA